MVITEIWSLKTKHFSKILECQLKTEINETHKPGYKNVYSVRVAFLEELLIEY